MSDWSRIPIHETAAADHLPRLPKANPANIRVLKGSLGQYIAGAVPTVKRFDRRQFLEFVACAGDRLSEPASQHTGLAL